MTLAALTPSDALYAMPVVATVVGCILGVILARHAWLNPWLVVGAVIPAVIVAIGYAGEHDPGVHTASFIAGMVLGPLLVGAAPFVLYYWAGRAFAARAVSLVILWILTIVPFLGVLLYAAFLTVGMVACPPGSYECPV